METPTLAPFVCQWAVLLVTYMRDGTPVGTPREHRRRGGSRLRTHLGHSLELRRIQNNPEVEVIPSTARGKPTGPSLHARARVLDGEESAHAGRLLARKHPILHDLLVPLVHRLRGNRSVHIELMPVSGRNPDAVPYTLRPEASSAASSGSRRPGG